MVDLARIQIPDYIRALPVPDYPPDALDALVRGRVIGPGESPEDMVRRVLAAIDNVERLHFDVPDSERWEFVAGVADDIACRLWTPGRPALTSLNRRDGPVRTGSSCTVLPRRHGGVAADYYAGNMGAAICFSDEDRPDLALLDENEFSAWAATELDPERAVSGMATLDVAHPRLSEFMWVKRNNRVEHFNTSVLLPTDFMRALAAGTTYTGSFGGRAVTLDPERLMSEMAEHIWSCGNPGVLFIDRIDLADATPALGLPRATAPCGEAALRDYEVCFFASLDLNKLVGAHPDDLDVGRLTGVVTRMVRALDDIADASLGHYPSELTDSIIRQRRQIGIGVCGYSDAGVRLRLPYASPRLLNLLQTALGHVTLVAQAASTDLAGKRKSFAAFHESRFLGDQLFLDQRLPAGRAQQFLWNGRIIDLRERVTTVGSRHSSIIAFPPQAMVADLLGTSGRGSLALALHARRRAQAAASRLDRGRVPTRGPRVGDQGDRGSENLQPSDRAPAGTRGGSHRNRAHRRRADPAPGSGIAIRSPGDLHDLNLQHGASSRDVARAILGAWESGLKAVSVYRDGSLEGPTTHSRALV